MANRQKLEELFFSFASPDEKKDYEIQRLKQRIAELENIPKPRIGEKGQQGLRG